MGMAGGSAAAERWFRIEYRRGESTRVLGRVPGVATHHTALDPWASELQRAGEVGELVLIDEATNRVVARRHLEHRPRQRRRPESPWSPHRR